MYKVGAFLIAVLVSCVASVYAAPTPVAADADIRIKCDNMSEDGVGTAYTDHEFYLDNAGHDAMADYWAFYLRNSYGEFEMISRGYGETLAIEKIRSAGGLYVNSNHALEGRIECTYILDKENVNTLQLPIFLELKPVIIAIDDVEKNYISLYDFYLSFSVNYLGANSVCIQVEDGNTYQLYQSPVAHFTTGILSNLYYTRVIVEVQNEYGSAQEMLEFAPEYENGGLPPVVDMTFEYLNIEEKSNEIRLYFSDLERVDHIIMECLREGSRFPNKFRISDMSTPYYDVTIFKATTFTAVAYNENGSTRGTPLYVPLKSAAGVAVVEDDAEIERVTVYDLSGRIMFDGTPESFATEQLSPGMYVKKEVLKEGVTRTSKIVVR